MLSTAATPNNDDIAEESKSATCHSDFTALTKRVPLAKKHCLEILKQIIAVKREQVFCQSADKDIFLTNDASSTNSSSNYDSRFSTFQHLGENECEQMSAGAASTKSNVLSNEEEVFLMNIDYFEQWDRIYLRFGA